MALFEVAEDLQTKDRQLLNARYVFHKLVWTRYREYETQGMSKGEARQRYRMAMRNYDQIIESGIDGASCEANQKDMDKGYV